MPTVKVFLNTGYKKKNGECAVYLIVHIDYKSLKFNTGVSCLEKKWNEKTLKIKGASKTVKDDNLIIANSVAQMNDIFVRYRLQHQHLTPELLKNEWKNPTRRIDFYKFFEEAIAERKKEIRPQTYKNHNSEINKLKIFKPVLAFSEFNPDFLAKYKRWLKTEKQNSINSIHTAMKVIKTYINIAIKKGVIYDNPFLHVRTKQTKPERFFLSSDELREMWELYNNEILSEKKQKVLRHFLFMCFTGCRISDFKALTQNEVRDKLLIYYPVKTAGVKNVPVKVPLSRYAKQLISDENYLSNFLFDVISEQKMNNYIKKIAGTIDIEKPLTNHSARHTFATVWLEKTHDLAALKELLGHSSITETMKYVHITDEMLMNQMDNFEANIFK
ncbi:MAG: site-specific integrase [Bacteroidetes bacterium]|nr:site-specific integrase [Bacteroidota bacterium]